MKKHTRRTLCVLLAALLCLPALLLCSCGGETGSETTTAAHSAGTEGAGDTTAEDTTPKFAEADYGGESFGVYMRSSTANHYPALYIYCPENATDIVNDQTQIRNQRVEEKYNVVLTFREASNPETSMQRDIASGHVEYDVVLAQRNCLSGLAYGGLLRNFNELDIDYTKTWWDRNAYEEYGYAGKLYVMPNDVSVANLSGCRLWWFNKAVLEDFNLPSPYDYVAKNEWVIDNFFTLIKSVSAPSADGQIGVYGMIKEDPHHLLTGIGSFRVEVDEEENIVCKIGTDYAEKSQNFFDKYKEITSDTNICITYADAAGMDEANSAKYIDHLYHARDLFAQGHFLFTQTSMNGSLEAFGESEKGIGAVMNPKYDSDQPEYYHQMDPNFPIWCIPKDANADLERLANVMDYWAYESSGTVMEAYYELTLKTKRATDPIRAEMLDIIKGSIRYYITDVFSVDISSFITSAYNTSVASAWAAMQKKLPRDLLKVQDKIKAIED